MEPHRAENPYQADQPPPARGPVPRPWERPPDPGVNARGLARCRQILREHGAREHGPYWQPREDS
jgi:hypothetical protein